eukprot:1607587-Prymnesium_polylepis.1
MLNEAYAEAKDDEEPLEHNDSKQQELLLVLCNMRKEYVSPIVTHRPSTGTVTLVIAVGVARALRAP